jgi:O-antigen ligase
MRGRARFYLLPLALALAPAVMLLLTWQDDIGVNARALKLFLPAVLGAELLVIYAAVRSGLRPEMPRAPLIALIALIAVAFGSAAFAPEPARSLTWTGIWIIHLAFGWAAGRLFDREAAPNALMAGFLLFAALLAVRAMSPVADWLYNPPGLDQLRRFAYYAAPIAGMAIGALAGQRRLFPFVVACVAFTMIFWNGARGAVVAVLVAAVAAFIVFPGLRRMAVAPMAVAAVGVGFLISRTFTVEPNTMGTGRMLSGGSSGRDWVWQRTVEAIMERPIFGWGEAQSSLFTRFAQPHNLLLQTLLAWGVVGTIFALYLGYAAARRAIPEVRADDRLLPAAVAAMTLAAYSLVDGTLYHILPTAIFAAMTGMMLTRAVQAPTSRIADENSRTEDGRRDREAEGARPLS